MLTEEDTINAFEEVMIFLEVVEAAAADCKRNLESIFGTVSGRKPKEPPPFNADLVNWVEEQGTRGKYERAYANRNSDNNHFSMMRSFLEKEQKKPYFMKGYVYWNFTGLPDVGRKPVKKKKT
jgi:hypothetical protein